MGEVLEARLLGPGGFRKRVALKILHRGGEELRREARIGGLLRHRNLVDIYEVGEDDGQWFCAMELCDAALTDHLPLPPRAVVEVGLQVCAALHYAHEELGLVHLDLKPQNLLLSQGAVKVADLGIARAHGFADGAARGTPGYMAPEQGRGGALDTRADLYALGVTLVELATGSRPREDETIVLDALDTLTQPAAGEATARDGEVPSWLAPAVGRCLAQDPSDRWPDMAALADALRALELSGPGLREALGLDRHIPPPRARRDTNLAAAPDAFVGRSEELERLVASLDDPGLITLKGPAGVGKSRLASEAAARWHAARGGQAWLCGLADARTRDGLLGHVARVLGIPLGSQDGATRIGHALAGRGPLVLVLDNFDPVVAWAGVVDQWRRAAPQARFAVTSRVALGLQGERVMELPPLDAGAAMDLLVARARVRGADVRGDPALPELARRLEGLPLALELAAGRLGVLSVAEVLDRLNLGLLRRATDDRHSTLRAALDWSWELLPEPERATLAQLSVFSGGFSLELAEEVVEVEGSTVIDTVTSLVDRSMVAGELGNRFSLLSSVQEFARERLVDADRAELRHGQAFARLRSMEVFLNTPMLLAADLDNLIVACRRAVARGDGITAVTNASCAWRILDRQGPYRMAAALFEDLVACPSLSPSERAWAQHLAGMALRAAGRGNEARTRFREALDAARGLDDREQLAWILSALANTERDLGNIADATSLLTEALDVCRTDRLGRAEGVTLCTLGGIHRQAGRTELALTCFEEAQALAREIGDLRVEAVALGNEGNVHHDRGRLEVAAACMERSVRMHRSTGDRRSEAVFLGNLAATQSALGAHADALVSLEQGVKTAREIGDRKCEGVNIGQLGGHHYNQGQMEEAGAHFSAALAIHRETGNRRFEAFMLLSVGDVHQELAQRPEARACYDAGLQIAQEIGERHAEGYAHVGLARVLLADRDPGAAEHMSRSEALAHETGSRLLLAHVMAARVEAELSEDRIGAAAAALAEAEAIVPPEHAALRSELRRLKKAIAMAGGGGADP